MNKNISEYSSYNTDNNVLTINHNFGSGFFSCCGIRLQEIINCYNQFHKLPILDSTKQWSRYVDKKEVVVPMFFKNTSRVMPSSDKIKITDNPKDDIYSMLLDDFSKLNFVHLNPFIQMYFSICDNALRIRQNLIDKYKINYDNTIAICYRGNDHVKKSIPPTYDEMLIKIKEVRNIYPDHKLLVQSDESNFYDTVLSSFKNTISINAIHKILKNPESQVSDGIPEGQKTLQAMLFLSIVSIISQCDKVITNSGNGALWIALYRNNTKGFYQYLNNGEKGKWFHND
jgi:hypothetical protein